MQNQKQGSNWFYSAEPETSLSFWEHDKAYMNLTFRTAAKLDNMKGNLGVGIWKKNKRLPMEGLPRIVILDWPTCSPFTYALNLNKQNMSSYNYITLKM